MDAVKSVFQLLDREIWIVTAATPGQRGGLTATWVAQASLDPNSPAVLVGIATNHHTAELIDSSSAFALHLIAEQQIPLAYEFAASSGRGRDKLANIPVTPGETGSPILSNCLAWLDCRVFARLEAGDRVYYWADVLGGKTRSSEPPLRESVFFANLSSEQMETLGADLEFDIRLERPAAAAWRASLPEQLLPRQWPSD